MTSSDSSHLNDHSLKTNFRVLYICSAARGGSTVTDMFIGGHSQASSLGEINLLGKSLSLDAECGCGSKLRSCGEWRKIFDAILSSRGLDLIQNPYGLKLWDTLAVNEIDFKQQTNIFLLGVYFRKLWMQTRSHLPLYLYNHCPIPSRLNESIQNKMDLYETIARCWGKKVIVDSSKNFREAVELNRRWPNIVKLILLVRDGRGVYLSRRSSGRSQSESVSDWLNYYRRALPLLQKKVSPQSLLQIKYEDLASDPEKIGRIICDFIGIEFESNMLDLSLAQRHLVNSNKTKFFPERGVQLDERWRSDLKGGELEFFERVGGEMNIRLGYH